MLSNLLHVLAASAASIPFVAAQTQTSETLAAPVTTDDLYAKISSPAAPAPGFNAEGGSVFQNFVDAVNLKQFFLLGNGSVVYEKPGSEPVRGSFLHWCSDLTFSDISSSSLMAYAGHCVGTFLAGYAEMTAQGADHSYPLSEGAFTWTDGISAIYVERS